MSVVIHSNFKHLLSHFMEFYQNSQESLGVPLSKIQFHAEFWLPWQPKGKPLEILQTAPPLPIFTGILGCSLSKLFKDPPPPPLKFWLDLKIIRWKLSLCNPLPRLLNKFDPLKNLAARRRSQFFLCLLCCIGKT